MLNRQGMIGGASINEVQPTQRPGQEVKLDPALEARRATAALIAAAAVGSGQGIRQANGRAVMNAHAGKPSQDRQGHGISGDGGLHYLVSPNGMFCAVLQSGDTTLSMEC